MAERDLVVRFIGDDRSLQQAFNRTERRGQQLERRTSRLGAGIATTFRTAGIAISGLIVADTLRGSISAASDLNEEISKSKQVFGDASDSVLDWSKTTATAMGVSQTEALRATGTFGNLFRVIDVGSSQSAEMSRRLVALAADLASFNNASPEDVLLAIRSGLIGEAEPLRRYGVLLSEARVQQVAMAASGKSNVRELTNQEKALARYNIILEDTKTAQGDFARTSDSLANQQRVLSANWKQLQATLGGALLPAVNATVGGLNDLFETGSLVAKVEQQIRDGINENNISMRDALPALEAYRAGLAGIKGEADALVIALDQIIAKRIEAEHRIADASRGEGRTAESVFQSNAAVDAAERQRREEARRNAREGQADINRIEREARERSLSQQLADSRRRAAHLRDLIRADSDNVKLQQRLRAELDTQASLRRQIADEAKSAAASDKAAAAAAKAAADEAARRQRQNRVAARQSRQFQALGLTATGDQRVPGVGALRRRLGTLRDQVEGTFLDTAKTERQLNAIGKVLSGKFGAVGREVREAILQMFADIAGALEGGGRKLEGPLTKTSGLVTRKIAEGLGLTPEQERELRARLSHFNTGGRAPAGGQDRRTGGGFVGGATFVIDNEVTVVIDGQKLTTTVTKQQQKAKRRNPRQKRGPARAGTGGH